MALIMCKKYIISAKIYIENISGNQKLWSYSASCSFNAGEKEIVIVLLRVPRHVERQKCQTSFSDAVKGPAHHYTEPRFRSAALGCLVPEWLEKSLRSSKT